jgi:hypothetical protein
MLALKHGITTYVRNVSIPRILWRQESRARHSTLKQGWIGLSSIRYGMLED